MLTIDDIRSVPLFSTLGQSELERLAQTSADLHLGAGQSPLAKVAIARYTRSRGQDRGQGRRRRRTAAGMAGGQHFRRGAGRARHAVSRRPGVRAFARNPRRRAPVLRSCSRLAEGLRNDWRAGTRAHRRIAGHRCGSAEGARAHRRASLGQRLQRDPPVSHEPPHNVRLDDTRRARNIRALAGRPPPT